MLCSCAFAVEPPKKFDLTYIVFRIDGMVVSISPVYGKVYGKVEAIEVAWWIPQADSMGKTVVINDKEFFEVGGDIRGAYFKAKDLFMVKVRELQHAFEEGYLPPEREYLQRK